MAETHHDQIARSVLTAAIDWLPRVGVTDGLIAEVTRAAGYSPAEVSDRWPTPAALRRACDAHVVATIGTFKGAAIASGTTAEPVFLEAALEMAPPFVRYIAWSVSTGDVAAAEFFDALVTESQTLFSLAETHQLLSPTPDSRERAAVVLAMQVGGIVLHEHLGRALGLDLLSPDGLRRLALLSMEVFTKGIFTTDGAAATDAGLRAALDGPDGAAGPGR